MDNPTLLALAARYADPLGDGEHADGDPRTNTKALVYQMAEAMRACEPMNAGKRNGGQIDVAALLAEAARLEEDFGGEWEARNEQTHLGPQSAPAAQWGLYAGGYSTGIKQTGGERLRIIARARTLLPALAAALRPFTAPVGVEAFEGLRREHDPGAVFACFPCSKRVDPERACTCPADAHNARVDAARAAHVAALANLAEANATIEYGRDAIQCAVDGENEMKAQLTALRSAILDGPNPTAGCPKCGREECRREHAAREYKLAVEIVREFGEAHPNRHFDDPEFDALLATKDKCASLRYKAQLDCRVHAVVWRDVLRGLWERAR